MMIGVVSVVKLDFGVAAFVVLGVECVHEIGGVQDVVDGGRSFRFIAPDAQIPDDGEYEEEYDDAGDDAKERIFNLRGSLEMRRARVLDDEGIVWEGVRIVQTAEDGVDIRRKIANAQVLGAVIHELHPQCTVGGQIVDVSPRIHEETMLKVLDDVGEFMAMITT